MIGYGESTPEEYANGTNPMFGLKSRGPNVKLVVTTSTKQGTSPLVQTGPKLSAWGILDLLDCNPASQPRS